jgi:hypothetical protein
MHDYRYPFSHDVANFIDYGTRLLERLKTEGSELSYTELRILSTQLGRISIAVKQLDDSRWRDRNNQAA